MRKIKEIVDALYELQNISYPKQQRSLAVTSNNIKLMFEHLIKNKSDFSVKHVKDGVIITYN